MDMFAEITAFADRWLGTALPQLFLLFLGVLLVILVVTALWDRRINRLGGVFGLLTGLLMTALALEESLARFIGGLDPAFRIRLTAVLFSLSLLFLTGSAWAKTGLQKRYGLTWTAVSLIVLLTALFPSLLRTFPSLLGVQYGLAVAALFIAFLLLLVFHFSITISELEKRQQALLRRISKLEGLPVEPEDEEEPAKLWAAFWQKWQGICRRPARGTTLGAPLIILTAAVSVFWVGMSAPQVMVGDEVTHYYMLKTQAEKLPLPNFKAEIPTGWGENEVRVYPHSFLWHYFGEIFFQLTGGSFAAVQFYQALYLIQFLGIAYLLARSRGGVQTRAAMPYLLILASLPMTLIFTVTFYQDVPMAAQVLTSFYFLRKNRWLLSTFFIAFALGIKVNAMLFFPAFFFCLLVWTARRSSIKKTAAIVSCSALLMVLCTWGLGAALKFYAGASFYPVEKFEQVVKKIWPEEEPPRKIVPKPSIAPQVAPAVKQAETTAAEPAKTKAKVITEQKASIIANHPGDLRITANYFIYGGLMLWLLLLTGIAAAVLRLLRHQPPAQEQSSCWLWGTGLSYIIIAAAFLASSPDARFFLPGLPFLLLPIAEQTVRLPRPKWLISFLASLALLQGGYVLAKTYKLRQVSPDLLEAIAWLKDNPPQPGKIFMYPEGNYRLFPVPHEWYLKYHLREFWRADNEVRAEVLRKFRIGAVVVKKHLVASVDKDITDLGVYPDYFVKDMRQDSRFPKLFENSEVVIFQTPPLPQVGKEAEAQ
jgi:hypothetical protein